MSAEALAENLLRAAIVWAEKDGLLAARKADLRSFVARDDRWDHAVTGVAWHAQRFRDAAVAEDQARKAMDSALAAWEREVFA